MTSDFKWLSEAIAHWRMNAVITDFGFFLDETWTESQIDVVTDLIKATCSVLSERGHSGR